MPETETPGAPASTSDVWPSLPYNDWKPTLRTLHMYAQIVGKIRLSFAPFEPQWANVPLYVTSRGLTTGPIPYRERSFQLDFDFVEHALQVAASDGRRDSLSLASFGSVAEFYAALLARLRRLNVEVRIWPMAVEVPNPVRFTEDTAQASYEPELASRFWQILVHVDAALKEHRAPFRGRHTPVQFFWGTFDLAYARFSGRPATPPSDDVIMRNAMDAEEICAGFWPGDERFPEPAFWCYGYPKPENIERAALAAPGAWNSKMGEFMLRYEDVRAGADPRGALRDFFTQTYEACAHAARWPDSMFS